MYLKSIEIQGFKSFANKIVFDFHNGITGIVGPNGSGKSNVADAVRWVLGEQKVKQLRSSSMQDVIFAGTQNRKPVSFAYVAITLDNADHALPLDYREITVARRVYRSGESEYLLNGNSCRLKDIHELFYDTGIGKEGYSIIGQGQIDRILSGKPEDRRELFDEAAGIVKFKRRKQQTLKKLENEQQNMVRITDILTELERQTGPLARQSEQARIYLKKRDELKNAEMGLFVQELERIHGESAEAAEKLEIARHQLEEVNAQEEASRSQSDALNASLEETDLRITALHGEVAQCDVEKERLEGQINVLREQIHTLSQSESHVKERLAELDEEAAGRQQLTAQYQEEKQELALALSALEKEQEGLGQELLALQEELRHTEETIERGQAVLMTLLDTRASIRGEQQRYRAIVEQTGLRHAQLEAELLAEMSSGTDMQTQLEEQEEALHRLTDRILRMEKKKIDVDQKRRKWRQQAAELNASLEEERRQLLRDGSRLESLKNIAERYDGYGNSIRRVMQRKAQVPGIHGVVADLIRVEKRNELAIETALGGSIQHIVTRDEQTAKEMISYLKEHRYGRATFLPLSSVTAPEHIPAKKALGEPGALGLADTLVHTEEQYRGVVGYLLGRILVTDTIDHAIAIQKKFRYSLRIVTLEGESLQPGGSMTGGAFQNNSNLLGRGREIEELEKKLSRSREQIKKLEARLEDVETADELLKDDFEEIQKALQEFYLRQNTLQVEVEHIREEKEQKEAVHQKLQEELSLVEAQKQEAAAKQKENRNRFAASKEEENRINDELGRENEKLHRLQEEVSRKQEEVTQQNVVIAQVKQKSDFAQENICRIQEEILGLAATRQDVLDNAANSGQEIAKREEEILALTVETGEALARREVLVSRLEEAQGKKEQLTGDNRQLLARREELIQMQAQLDREIFRVNDRLEKLDAAREEQTDYMWREYELTLHEAKTLCQGELTAVRELKKQISAIREEIRGLGHVNVNAIEEYKEISQRYEFMKSQHEDLLQAEKTLQDIIADLDEGMKKQFSARFSDIQQEFDLAFQELFGGGKGTLELAVDSEKDILECGVRIIAQPPGKKLQNMMQLSGGEKALTAIALLFAIQNLKPSPFCLLDEIEAALDDPNVERYARYLHKLTEHTQFIVITHRRGTMIAADRLYGITMQEKGVSALVSVNLIEKELED